MTRDSHIAILCNACDGQNRKNGGERERERGRKRRIDLGREKDAEFLRGEREREITS